MGRHADNPVRECARRSEAVFCKKVAAGTASKKGKGGKMTKQELEDALEVAIIELKK